MGAAVRAGSSTALRTSARAALAAALLLVPSLAAAEQRQAIIVSGATGGERYAASYAEWEAALVKGLRDRCGFAPERIVVLSAAARNASAISSRENVRRALEDLRRTSGRNDLSLVILIGHGTVDAESAKFNLVGPDLEAAEWADLLREVPGRLVVVNTTGGSFPFLEHLSGRNRIVITATDSAAQRFDTVFPEQLVLALGDPDTDLDKNGRLSLWELFSRTSAGVKRHYEQRGQLATERALLDDNGDRLGIEADAPGQDGAIARTTYLDVDPLGDAADPALAALAARQRELEERAEQLKLRKPTMTREAWEAEFEALMIELARVSRRIRTGS